MSDLEKVNYKMSGQNFSAYKNASGNYYTKPKFGRKITNAKILNALSKGQQSSVATTIGPSRNTGKGTIGYNSASSSSSSSSSGISGVAGSSSTVGIKTLGGAGGVSSSNPKKRNFGRFNEEENIEENEDDYK